MASRYDSDPTDFYQEHKNEFKTVVGYINKALSDHRSDRCGFYGAHFVGHFYENIRGMSKRELDKMHAIMNNNCDVSAGVFCRDDLCDCDSNREGRLRMAGRVKNFDTFLNKVDKVGLNNVYDVLAFTIFMLDPRLVNGCLGRMGVDGYKKRDYKKRVEHMNFYVYKYVYNDIRFEIQFVTSIDLGAHEEVHEEYERRRGYD